MTPTADVPDEEHDLRSHALSILASRGLLLPARYRQQRPSSRVMPTPMQLKMRVPAQQRPLNYRQLLVARAMMSAAEADMVRLLHVLGVGCKFSEGQGQVRAL